MASSQFRPPSAKVFQFLYSIGLGTLVGKMVLLLTTTGRKSGLPRTTALQYEEIGDDIYLGSSRGLEADWVKNILANPQVKIQVKKCQIVGNAEVVTDAERIADFLQVRLQRHPRMVGMIMKSDGLPEKPSRADLAEYARKLALVIVRPIAS